MTTKWMEMTDQSKLFVRDYPVDDATTTVVVLHGLAEHSARYEQFAGELNNKGYHVLVPDHRGHGQTGERAGRLGYFAEENGFERVVDDVNELIQHHLLDYPSRAIFLVGHSMGSFLARRYVQKYPAVVDKLVLIGTGGDPGLLGAFGARLATYKARGEGATQPGTLMNKLTFGNYNKGIEDAETESDWLSTDPEVVRDYLADPYCGFVPTNKLYQDLLQGLITIHATEQLARMRKSLPVLLIAGTDDPVGDYGKGVRKVALSYQKAGSEDVKLVLIEGQRHEILNGKGRQTVVDQILGWL